MMFDVGTTYAIFRDKHQEMLREADRVRLADQISPAHGPGLRGSLSHWLHSLANYLEPAPERRVTPARLHAR